MRRSLPITQAPVKPVGDAGGDAGTDAGKGAFSW